MNCVKKQVEKNTFKSSPMTPKSTTNSKHRATFPADLKFTAISYCKHCLKKEQDSKAHASNL